MGQEGGGIDDRAHVDSGRGERIGTLAQLAVMAAIVATLIYFPLVLVLGLALRAAGFELAPLATFGGAFSPVAGLALWWLIVFAGAFVYAACMFPWGDKVLEWPKKR